MPVTISIPARPGFPPADIYTRISTPGDTAASHLDRRYPTVVFVPSIWTDSFFFYPQFDDPALFEHHNLVSFDPRGHGLTKGPAGEGRYDWAAVADDLDAILSALEVQEVHLIGSSKGANAVLYYAAARPDSVLSLTLINRPHPVGDGVSSAALKEVQQAVHAVVKDEDADLLDNITSAVFDFNVGWCRTPALEEFQADLKDVYRARMKSGELAATASFLDGLIASSKDAPSIDALRDLSCPILLLRGDGDGCESADADQALVDALGRHRAALQIIEAVPRWMTLTSPNIINPILAYHLIPTAPSTPITPLLPTTPISGTRSISRRPSTPRDVTAFAVPLLTKNAAGTLTIGDMLDQQQEAGASATRRDSDLPATGIAVQTEVIVVVEES